MAGDPLAQVDLPLARLDRLLEREILRLRARYQLSLDEFRGLYVSDEQVDRLVRGRGDRGGRASGSRPRPRRAACSAPPATGRPNGPSSPRASPCSRSIST